MTRHKKLLVLVPLLIAFGAGGAYAYFTTVGAGSADASTGTLAAPTITTATPSAGSVALTWSSVTAPAGGTITYYVRRDGGAPAGNCPDSASPTSVTSCTDSGLTAGSYSYTVTAVWRSWTATSASTTVTVASGTATHLVLTAGTTTPTAGTADNLTITAKDAANNTVTAYTGDKSLTFSGAANAPDGTHPTVSDKNGAAVNFGVATTTTFSSGVASVSGSNNGVMRLYKAETANIAVTDGSIGDAGLPVTVSPASAGTLAVSGYPTPTVAGISHSFSVTARDAFGNTAIGYTGTVAFSATNDGQAVLPANSTLTAGTGTFNATFKTVAGGTKTLTATDIATSSITGSRTGIVVDPAAAATLQVAGYPSSTVAGDSHLLAVTARDAFGNTATGYSGTVAFSATNDPAALLPANSTLAAGTGTFNATFRTVVGGNKTLTATDTVTSSITGSQTAITVTPAAAAALLVAGYPSSTVAGVPHSFTVTAQDAFGNTATGYAGTVQFSAANDAQAVLPANSTISAGTGTFNATFKTVTGGSKTLTATDTVTSSITGSQAGITVTPAAAASIAVVSGSGQSATVNTAFANALVALVRDSFANPVPGVSVTFAGPLTGASGTFASTDCTSNSPTSQCVATTGANGEATSSSFTANGTTGTYNVSANVTGAGSVNFAMTNTSAAASTFTVTAPPTATAGTSFFISLTAKIGAATDVSYTGTKCIVFSGPASSPAPTNTAPTYPPAGSCSSGSSVSFSAGVATNVPVTLYKALLTTNLTATQGAYAGTAGTIAVNSAGVALSYNPACGSTIAKSQTTQFAIVLPNDVFSNPYTRNTPAGITLTLGTPSNIGFGTLDTASGSVTLSNGATFNLAATSGNNKTSNLAVTAGLPSGFSAPAATACVITTSN
jgi:hypothetical protein